MMKSLLPATFLILAIPLGSATEWSDDYEAAQAEAAKEEKDLFLNFTGSDWCGWCVKLKDEVLSQEAFSKGTSDHFVLVTLDFPKSHEVLEELSLETRKQNQALQQKYQVQAFPTILLTDAEGRPYAKTGYLKGGPEAYLEHLNELRQKREDRDTAFRDAETKSGAAKAQALFKGLQSIPKAYWGFYGDVIATIRENDPDDTTGLVAESEREAAILELEKRLQFAMQNKQPGRALNLVDEFIEEHRLEGEERQNLLATKLNVLNVVKDSEAMEKVVDEIIAIDPESAYSKKLAGFKATQLQELKKEAQEGGE
jgi:thioredoxin-related protein